MHDDVVGLISREGVWAIRCFVRGQRLRVRHTEEYGRRKSGVDVKHTYLPGAAQLRPSDFNSKQGAGIGLAACRPHILLHMFPADCEVTVLPPVHAPSLPAVDASLAGEREMVFGHVELLPLEGAGEEKQALGELMVSRGFASVVRHRSDEERSCIYERLVEVEELAKQAKRGQHSNKEPPVHRTNDVSAPGNSAKAKQFLPFLQRAGERMGRGGWERQAHV